MTEARLDDGIAQLYTEGIGSVSVIRAQYGSANVLEMPVEAAEVAARFDPSDESDEFRNRVAQNITRLYDSVTVYTAKNIDGNDYDIEFGVLESAGGDVMLHDATYSSALSNNPGNVFEQAVAHTLRPNMTHVYVGSLGMGLSSPLTPRERRHVRRTGSLLEYDSQAGKYQALPAVTALARVLVDEGLVVQHLESDSAGAMRSVALGAAYGKGDIRTSHQNVRAGIKDLSALALAKGMLLDDGAISREHERFSPDPLKMRDEVAAFTLANASEDYKGRGLKPKRSAAMYASYLVGLTHGPNAGFPMLHDNVALVQANPDARVLFTSGELDVLSRGLDLQARLIQVTEAISQHTNLEVSAAILPGIGHGPQTHYPQYLRALASTILGR